jgi:TolB-like protein
LIKKALEETRSRDEVIGILQEMAAKHAKEKEAAAAEIEDLKGEVTAKENRLSVKSRLLDEAEEKVERFKALSPDKQLIELQNSATTSMREVLCVLSGRFRHSLQNIADHCQNQDADESVFMSGLVKQIQHELIRVNDMFLLDGAIPNPPPEWMTNSRFDEVFAVVPDPSKH